MKLRLPGEMQCGCGQRKQRTRRFDVGKLKERSVDDEGKNTTEVCSRNGYYMQSG